MGRKILHPGMDESSISTETIGVLGIQGGCGTTHFSVMLANYLAAAELKKTALLERNTSGDIGRIIEVCTGKQWEKMPVSILDVDYFPHSSKEELGSCIQSSYDAVILDFGIVREAQKTEFFQCRKQYLIGALNEWKLDGLMEHKAWILKGKGRWKYLTVFGSEEARRELRRRFGLSFEQIPFAPDAFAIDSRTAEFFRKIRT